MRPVEKALCGSEPANRSRTATSENPSPDNSGVLDLKALWQAILDCECGGWCNNCCDNFSAIGEALDRKCPVCGRPCEVVIACPEHE